MLEMTRETQEVHSDKRKPREDRPNHRSQGSHRYIEKQREKREKREKRRDKREKKRG